MGKVNARWFQWWLWTCKAEGSRRVWDRSRTVKDWATDLTAEERELMNWARDDDPEDE